MDVMVIESIWANCLFVVLSMHENEIFVLRFEKGGIFRENGILTICLIFPDAAVIDVKPVVRLSLKKIYLKTCKA